MKDDHVGTCPPDSPLERNADERQRGALKDGVRELSQNPVEAFAQTPLVCLDAGERGRRFIGNGDGTATVSHRAAQIERRAPRNGAVTAEAVRNVKDGFELRHDCALSYPLAVVLTPGGISRARRVVPGGLR